jgi:hypothetical protein
VLAHDNPVLPRAQLQDIFPLLVGLAAGAWPRFEDLSFGDLGLPVLAVHDGKSTEVTLRSC